MADEHTVEYVSRLARIMLTDDEKEVIQDQFSHILEYIDTLTAVNIDGVEPMRGLHQDHDVFRADIVKPSTLQQSILENAPLREGDYFKIPKVLE